MIQNGRKIVYSCFAILVITHILNALFSYENPLPHLLIILASVVASLFSLQHYGAVLFRKLFIIFGIVGLLFNMLTFWLLWNNLTVSVSIVLSLYLIRDAGLILVIALSKSVKVFCNFEEFEKDESQETQNNWGNNTTVGFDKIEKKKPCPVCNEQTSDGHIFCQFCGCNIAEKEEENNKLLREKFEKGGLSALLDSEKIMNNANLYLRFYGKSTCISFLKDTAKEMGIEEIEISEDELDILLR